MPTTTYHRPVHSLKKLIPSAFTLTKVIYPPFIQQQSSYSNTVIIISTLKLQRTHCLYNNQIYWLSTLQSFHKINTPVINYMITIWTLRKIINTHNYLPSTFPRYQQINTLHVYLLLSYKIPIIQTVTMYTSYQHYNCLIRLTPQQVTVFWSYIPQENFLTPLMT